MWSRCMVDSGEEVAHDHTTFIRQMQSRFFPASRSSGLSAAHQDLLSHYYFPPKGCRDITDSPKSEGLIAKLDASPPGLFIENAKRFGQLKRGSLKIDGAPPAGCNVGVLLPPWEGGGKKELRLASADVSQCKEHIAI